MANAPRMFGGFFGNGGGGQNQGAQGDAGAGGENHQEGDDTRTGGQQQEQQDDESLDSLIGTIFGDDEEDDGDDKNQNQNQNNQQQQQQQQNNNQNQQTPPDPGATLAAEISAAIKGIKVAEDVIPADFNPADPKQLRDLLGTVQQQGVMTAIQLAMKPMQLAMESQQTQIKQMIQQAINDGLGSFDSKQILSKIVPEVNDPKLKGMVQSMFDTASKKMNANKAANTVRKALDVMGLKRDSNQGGGNDPFQGGFKQGNSALDTFLPGLSNQKK